MEADPVADINATSSDYFDNTFKDLSAGSLTPESTVRGSGSEGYLGDDDCDLSSNDECEDTQPLTPASTQNSRRSSFDSKRSNSPTKSSLFQEASSLSSRKKFIFGLLIVVVISLSWVVSTQTAQSTYNGTFSAPFFLVWIGTSLMVIVFPLTAPFYFVFNHDATGIKKLWRHSTEIITSTPFSPLSILTSTVLFSILWMPTNYLYVRALSTIPATDVTAIFSTAPAFVFIFSMIILREPPLIIRFIAVLLSVGGIVLFAFVNGFGAASVSGVLMSVGAAIGAALYKTLLKWRVKDASIYQMSLFVSSIGLFNMLIFWPIVVLLHITGVEMLVDIPWTYIIASSLAGVLFNFAINFGIAYTFPLFISLGTIMGVPINAIFDAFIRHVDLVNWKITAMDLIIGGFLLILAPPSLSRKIERFLICCKTKFKKYYEKEKRHISDKIQTVA